MNEIINNVDRILGNYDISFRNLNDRNSQRMILEAQNASNLKSYIKEKFSKEINADEASELEFLFQTYQYLS